jgi:hypothetical protein
VADAPIGNLVAKLVLDSTGWRAEFQKSQRDVEGFSRNVRRHTTSASQAFREVTLTTRQLGGTLASTLSPQLGQTISLFGSLGTALTRLPVVAGGVAAAVVAAVAVIIPAIQAANKSIDDLTDIRFAERTGDLAALTTKLTEAGKTLEGLQTESDLARRSLSNAFTEPLEALRTLGAKVREFFSWIGGVGEQAEKTGRQAGQAFIKVLPIELRKETAQYNEALQKTISSQDLFQASLAETVNDEVAFIAAISRSIEALKEATRQQDAFNRAQAEDLRAKTQAIADPEARRAQEARITEQLKRQLDLSGETLRLTIDQLHERQRAGVLGIRERRQAAFPAEAGLEETGLRESLIGAPRGVVGAAFPEVLAKAQEAVRGFDTALGDLERQARIIGPTFDLEAVQLAALSSEFQRVSGFGDQFDDKLKELSDRMKRLGVDKAMKDLANSTRIAEEEALAFNQALTGSGEAIDTVRSRYAALIETMRELIRQRQASSEEFRQLARELEELRGLVYVKDLISETFGALSSGLNSSIQGVITGTQTLKEAFANLGQSIVLSITQMIINRGLKVLEQAIQDLLNSAAVRQFLGSFMGMAGAATAGGTAPVGTAPTGITWGQGLASGAVVKARAGGVPVIVAEGGQDEAIIPLNRAMGQLGGGVTIVNEIHNHTDAQVETRQQRGSNGQMLNQIIIRAVQGAADNGSLDKTLGRNYGLTRTGR